MKNIKLISLILIFCLLFCSISAAGLSEEAEIDQNALPQEVQQIIDENGYTGVCETNKEDACSITFTKDDDSKVLYIYDAPVKYKDDSGEIKFKTNRVKGSEKKSNKNAKYAYENESNDIKTYLPQRINDGVLVEKDGYRVESFPLTEKNSKVKLVERDGTQYLEYDKAMGKHAHLSYTYTFDGLKENIILDKYMGQNEFSFRINTYGLVPDKAEGMNIHLCDPETGESVFSFSQPDAEDARFAEEQKPSLVSFNNYYTIEKDPSAGDDENVYILTEVIDEEFLRDENTQYPVIIDPQVRWTYASKDVTVYKNSTDKDITSNWLFLGNMNLPACPNYGDAIAMVQLNMEKYLYLNPDFISNVEYRANIMTAPSAFSYYLAVPSSEWTPENATYAKASNSSVYGSANTLSANTTTTVTHTITALMKDWIRSAIRENYTYSAARGFVFKAVNPASNTQLCRIYSNESGSDCPTIKVTYTEDNSLREGSYYIQNVGSGKCMDVDGAATTNGTNVSQFSFSGETHQLWNIKKANNGNSGYIVYPAHAPNTYLSLETPNSDTNYNNIIISKNAFVWHIIKNGDGSYRLISETSSGRGPDISGSSNLDSANIVQYSYVGNIYQKWKFNRVYLNAYSDTSSYNRTVASKYADDYGDYNSASAWDTPNYRSVREGGNCTNFVSQCLKEGGLSETGDSSTRTEFTSWHYGEYLFMYHASYTWGGAPNFARHWGA